MEQILSKSFKERVDEEAKFFFDEVEKKMLLNATDIKKYVN